MYSAMNSIPNRIPPYSVHHPSTSSASASGMSNGTRSTSAIMVTRKRTAPSGIRKMFQAPAECWKWMLSMMLNVPERMATDNNVRRSGIS